MSVLLFARLIAVTGFVRFVDGQVSVVFWRE